MTKFDAFNRVSGSLKTNLGLKSDTVVGSGHQPRPHKFFF